MKKSKTYSQIVDEINNPSREAFLKDIKQLNKVRSLRKRNQPKILVDRKWFKEQILHCGTCKHRIKCVLTGADETISKKYANSVLFEIYRQARVNYKENQFKAGRYFQQQYTNVLSGAIGYRHKLRKFVGTMLDEVHKCNLLNTYE
jgi:hypothetical protein